jgi:hypothetical protein
MVEEEEIPRLPVDALLRLGDGLNRLNCDFDHLTEKCDDAGRRAHCQDRRFPFRRRRYYFLCFPNQ